MVSDEWFGAAATLAGAAVAGLISLALSRQQLTEARRQRREDEERARAERGEERRFRAYADFASCARSYRDDTRLLLQASAPPDLVQKLDELAHGAIVSAELVFLVVESNATHDACRAVTMAIVKWQAILRDPTVQPRGTWTELNNEVAQLLRNFQVAARQELAVIGVDAATILDRSPEAAVPIPERTVHQFPTRKSSSPR